MEPRGGLRRMSHVRRAVVITIVAAASGVAWAAPATGPVRTVFCAEVIDHPRFPYRSDGYRLVLGAFSVPPAYLRQVIRVGGELCRSREGGQGLRRRVLPTRAKRLRTAPVPRRRTKSNGPLRHRPPMLTSSGPPRWLPVARSMVSWSWIRVGSRRFLTSPIFPLGSSESSRPR
jgi:hypothetical protein